MHIAHLYFNYLAGKSFIESSCRLQQIPSSVSPTGLVPHSIKKSIVQVVVD